MKKSKCYNCKHATKGFKVINITHHHCFNEELYPVEEGEKGNISPWETLRVFSDTCDKHEFKQNEAVVS